MRFIYDDGLLFNFWVGRYIGMKNMYLYKGMILTIKDILKL